MFGTIRKHQNWLWFIVVAVVIVSFVVYFDPSQRGGRGGRGGGAGELGRIDDHVVTPRELEEARREFKLIYFLNTRKWPEEDREHSAQIDEEREAAARLLNIVKAEQAGIRVPDTAVAEMAHRLLGGANLDQVAREVLVRGGVTADDFERFVRHELMRQQLASVVGMAGQMVTPAEAEDQYRREHEEISGEMVLFTVSNYMPRVTLSNDVLLTWYTNRMAQYRTPEKIRVSYVSFPASNFLAEADKQIETATNLNLQIEQDYAKRGTNAFKDTNGVTLSHDQAIARIKEDYRHGTAMLAARRKANDFGNKLMDAATKEGSAPKASALEGVAKQEKLTVQVSEPFDMQDGPTNMNVGPDFGRMAFSLDPTNNPISFQPLAGDDSFYVIALKDTTPSRLQTYAEVKDKVADDYKRSQAFMLARQDAMEFQAKVTNALASGKSFDQVATDSKLKAITLPPLSQHTESLTNIDANLNVRQVRSVLFSLEPGHVSPFIPNPPEGGYVAYMKQKLPIDEAKMKADMPKFLAEVRYQRQNEVYSAWFRKQYEKAAQTFPILAKQAKGGRG